MFHFRSGVRIVPLEFSIVQVSRPHDLVGITHYAKSYTHTSTTSPGPRSSCTSSTQFWMVRSGPHAERSGPSASVATRVQLPTDAERDRNSVGGAHELSGTDAQSWRFVDISCELPAGGPYVPEPMKFQHADQHPPRTWMNRSGGPIHICPNCSLYKHEHPPSRLSVPDKQDARCQDGGRHAESRGLTHCIRPGRDAPMASMQNSRMSPAALVFRLRTLSHGIAAVTRDRSRNRYGRKTLSERRFPSASVLRKCVPNLVIWSSPDRTAVHPTHFSLSPMSERRGLACEVGATEEHSCAAPVAGVARSRDGCRPTARGTRLGRTSASNRSPAFDSACPRRFESAYPS